MYIEELHLGVTRMCTIECEHCLRGDRKNEYMSKETINNVLSEVKHIGKLLITGGEPLLATNQIKEIINVIKKNDIKVDNVILISNATVLNDDVIEVLYELKKMPNFKFMLSYDMFHYLELQRLNLLEKRNFNAKIFIDKFGAKEYGKDDKKDKVDQVQYKRLGRAKNITDEMLAYINSLSNTKYVLSDDTMDYFIRTVSVDYHANKNSITGVITVDVNGNITGYGESFEDEDDEVEEYDSNINKLGLTTATENYIEYYDTKCEKYEVNGCKVIRRK